MQKITPCLWFNDQAEDAAKFYTSIFKNSKIITVIRYGEAASKASGQPLGTVMTVLFQLDGQEFLALNGGPVFSLSPAISFIANCDSQDEIDELWEKLSEGGSQGQCGWLTDKFGMSWQITPRIIGELLQDADESKTENVMRAVLEMNKIDMDLLQDAYAV